MRGRGGGEVGKGEGRAAPAELLPQETPSCYLNPWRQNLAASACWAAGGTFLSPLHPPRLGLASGDPRQ